MMKIAISNMGNAVSNKNHFKLSVGEAIFDMPQMLVISSSCGRNFDSPFPVHCADADGVQPAEML
jgi:hypothetical protein